MFLAVFHQETRRVFLGQRGKKSRFGHVFGGAADYSGVVAHKGQPPVHLLFRLDTADPAIGIKLPGAQWLPLLCAIRYGACDLGYRVVSDREVAILHQGESKAWDDFPYDDYPEKLPARPVELEEASFDLTNPRDALYYAGFFGCDVLTPKQFARLARYVVAEGIYDPDICEAESPEEYLREEHSGPFVQGRPDADCPNPACSQHGRAASLRTFAVFQEEGKAVRKLWGPNCDSLQIIYQICPQCEAVRTSNQCT